jgi:hypothetical protein
MTKKLESLFNLPETSDEPSVTESQAIIEENKEVITAVNTAIDKIDAALPLVRDLETGDNELDELAQLATDKFQDLMDLGMNVDARFSGTILQTAGTLLGHAITAKTAKMDKKLRMIQLQLSKERLDFQREQAEKKLAVSGEESIEGQGVILDRNALLQQILNKPTEQNSTK